MNEPQMTAELLNFLDQAPAFIYLMDESLRYVYLNRAARNSGAFDTSDDRELTEADRIVLTSSQKIIDESEAGGIILLNIRWPLFDDDGQVYGIGGISLDVTEMAEEQRTQLRWVSNALETSNDIVEAISAAAAEIGKHHLDAFERTGNID